MFPGTEPPRTTWQSAAAPARSAGGARPARDARLPELIGQDADTAARLGALKIGVIGTGAVGRTLALHLARLQIDTLWLVDPGAFKPESLLTQAIGPEDVGRPKAAATAAVCKSLAPDMHVWAFAGPAEELGPLDLADADLILLATDNLAAEVDVGQRCLHLGRPLVQASVHGGTLTAQVRFYANDGDTAACPACGFGDAEWDMLNRHTRFSCDDGGTAGATGPRPHNLGPATASFSFLCSLAADLALVQVVRHVLRLGPATGDVSISYCGFTHRTASTPLARNPRCRCEHVTWRRAGLSRPLPLYTLRGLAAAAGVTDDAWPRVSVTLDGAAWVAKAACAACGRQQDLGRYVRAADPLPACSACGGKTVPLPLFTHRRAPLASLDGAVDRPLCELMSGPPGWAVLHAGSDGVCFRHPSDGDERSASWT